MRKGGGVHGRVLYIICTCVGGRYRLYTGGCNISFSHGRVLYIVCTWEGAMFHWYTTRCVLLFLYVNTWCIKNMHVCVFRVHNYKLKFHFSIWHHN